MSYIAKIGERQFEVTNEDLIKLDITKISTQDFHVLQNFQSHVVNISFKQPKSCEVTINGNKYLVEILDEYEQLVDKMGLTSSNTQLVREVKAPMPGLTLSVHVEAGQEVSKGDALVVLEAMKMENLLKSPSDGRIKAVYTTKGQAVEKGQLLVVFE
jgi:biotin carboxyl carrier protein